MTSKLRLLWKLFNTESSYKLHQYTTNRRSFTFGLLSSGQEQLCSALVHLRVDTHTGSVPMAGRYQLTVDTCPD